MKYAAPKWALKSQKKLRFKKYTEKHFFSAYLGAEYFMKKRVENP